MGLARGFAAGLVVALASTAARGQDPSDGPRRHRVHDLVSRVDRCEAPPLSIHHLTRQALVDAEDPRTGVAFLRTPPGRWVAFHDLPTRGRSTLSFAVGISGPAFLTQALADDRPVRFLADVSSEHDPTWRRVFERVLRPSDLPPATRLLPFEIELPGQGPLVRSLRLVTQALDPAGDDEPWPGWSCPQVRSDGVPGSILDQPIVLSDAGRDLLAELSEARLGGGADATLHAVDPAPGAELLGGARPALRLDAPARATWTLDLPPGAELTASIGVDAVTSWHLGGGELELAVQVADRPVAVLPFDAARRQQDRGWRELRVDLSAWAGSRTSVGLALSPGRERGPDVLGVAGLRLRDGRGIPRRPAGAGPTIVVLLADTLRRDAVGPSTPHLSRLAEAGLRFREARSTSSWTWPATGSLFTGLDPLRHGLLDASRPALDARAPTLAGVFAAAGYTTAAFVANPLVSGPPGLTRGFETFVLLPDARAGTLNARVEAWLGETDGAARFLYVHYMDPHAPYAAPGTLDRPAAGPAPGEQALSAALGAALELGLDHPRTRAQVDLLRRAYQSELADLDAAVGELLERLAAHGALEDAWVVFLSDHGEEFLEHGRVSHGGQLFDETLAVPLSLTGFGRAAITARTIDTPVSTRDIFPTLCALAGLEPPPGLAAPWPVRHEGTTGAPWPAGPLFAHTLLGREHGVLHTHAVASVLVDGHKLVLEPESGRRALFRLADDPHELHDLATADPARTASLATLLADWLARDAGRGAAGDGPSDAEQERARQLLEQLGYVGR